MEFRIPNPRSDCSKYQNMHPFGGVVSVFSVLIGYFEQSVGGSEISYDVMMPVEVIDF